MVSWLIAWFLKIFLFPQRNFDQENVSGVSIWELVKTVPMFFSILYTFPSLAILSTEENMPSPLVLFCSLILYIVGIVTLVLSEAQTSWMILHMPQKLITEGMYKWVRFPDFLGEFMMVSAFAILTRSLLTWLLLISVFSVIVIPFNLDKERALSRFAEWSQYKASTGMYLPNIFASSNIKYE